MRLKPLTVALLAATIALMPATPAASFTQPPRSDVGQISAPAPKQPALYQLKDVRVSYYGVAPGAVGGCFNGTLVGHYAAIGHLPGIDCGDIVRVHITATRWVRVRMMDHMGSWPGGCKCIDLAPAAFSVDAPLSQGVFMGRVVRVHG